MPPAAVLDAAEAPPRHGAISASTVTPKRILVIDDNVDSADSMSLLLQSLGHEVRIAFDGRAAVEEVEGFRPEVVLLDIALPRIDGFEVARRIRQSEHGSGVFLIALTGYDEDEYERQIAEAGFVFHMAKPVRTSDVHRYLQGSQ